MKHTTRRGGTEFTADSSSIPADPSEPLVIGEKPINRLEIGMPSEAVVSTGVEASDGTVVYQSTDGAVDIAAQVLDANRVRVQTIINTSAAAHEFTYEIGNGFAPVEAADGTFWVYKFKEDGEIQIYRVGPAWARDAGGAPVETHYVIRGNSIVQEVSHSSKAVYPIVADPTSEWYNAAYGAGFSKKETRDLLNLGGIPGFCAFLWRFGLSERPARSPARSGGFRRDLP